MVPQSPAGPGGAATFPRHGRSGESRDRGRARLDRLRSPRASQRDHGADVGGDSRRRAAARAGSRRAGGDPARRRRGRLPLGRRHLRVRAHAQRPGRDRLRRAEHARLRGDRGDRQARARDDPRLLHGRRHGDRAAGGPALRGRRRGAGDPGREARARLLAERDRHAGTSGRTLGGEGSVLHRAARSAPRRRCAWAS